MAKMSNKKLESFIKRLSLSQKYLVATLEDDNCSPTTFEKVLTIIYNIYSPNPNYAWVSSDLFPRKIFLALITHPLFTLDHLPILLTKPLGYGDLMDITFFFRSHFLKEGPLLDLLKECTQKFESRSSGSYISLLERFLSERTNSYKRQSFLNQKFLTEYDQMINYLETNAGGYTEALLSENLPLRSLAASLYNKHVVK